MSLENVLGAKRGFIHGTGASDEKIKSAEEELQVCFAQDYKEYLRKYGVVAFDSRELTGITDIARINVVTVTNSNRQFMPEISKEWYVIEELNIDGVVIWQDQQGRIFQTIPSSEAIQIFDSLEDYLSE